MSDPGYLMHREAAPELRHAGLFLGFGQGLNMPVVMARSIPLFGEAVPFPGVQEAGAIFMTTAHDTLATEDLEHLSECLFGVPQRQNNLRPSHEAFIFEELFRQVLADAYHIDAAA